MKTKASTLIKPTISYGGIVGRVIQQHRKHAGIDQKEVAEALGITQSSYSKLENGQSAMTLTQLNAVANRIGKTASEILKEVDKLSSQLRSQGVIVTEEKEVSQAALLIALGILAMFLASLK